MNYVPILWLINWIFFLGNDNNEEWEAELEGELNEFEMVNSKEEDPEWENQIQQMLDAEEKQN